MVLRVIPQILPTIDGLGVPQVLKEISQSKRGLTIMVGATGSGKSTTLAAMVDWRNENSYGHIITIEDPVEFVHMHKNCVVTQREVGLDTDSWEAALKNTLRQAPDVILMGEIRDRETMEHAVAFAETGHLCLATLHANSANQALDRIINFFPEERRAQLLMDLSLNLRALVSQRLIPKQDGKGRVAAVEIMINSPLISDLIFKGDVIRVKEIMKKSRNMGMQTFDQALFDLYEATRSPSKTHCAMPTRSTTCACKSSSTASAANPPTCRRVRKTLPSCNLGPAKNWHLLRTANHAQHQPQNLRTYLPSRHCGLSGPGGDGLSHGRSFGTRRAPGHGLQPQLPARQGVV
jgi:pilus retraction protein PilT